jgi:hypothetical protein
MSNVGNTRKLFLDSRFKISGTDSDFTIELPQDVQCTRTSSFFVASCSFANTYGAITDFNNKLYFLAIHPPPNFGPPCRLYVRTIPKGVYTQTTFATALQTALNQDTRSPCTVTWNDGSGNYQIEFAKGSDLLSWVIPSFDTVDALVAYAGIQLTIDGDYSRGPKYYSVNTLLNMPTTPISLVGAQSITTGTVDLSPIREIYLHSSLANNRTLHINGARDCIARIPIDVFYGEVVSYRYLGPTDAISCSDANFRTISFQLRDFAGNLLPAGSFVVIELAFLDTDPYTM